MKHEIKVPAMGESISEVTIGTILIPSGSVVKADEAILELETDKVNQLLYAPQTGKLSLSVQSGDTAKIGQVIGSVEESKVSEAKPSAVSEEKPKQKEKKVEIQKQEKQQEKQQERPPYLPQVRQTKEVFLNELKKPSVEIQPQPKEKERVPVKDIKERKETRRRMSNIRKVIAKRLVEAQHTAAMLTTFNEIDLSQVIALRQKYKESFAMKYGVNLGFMSFFIKASVAALQLFPDLNSYIDGEEIVHREYYDMGVAVGTEKGLIVPVIRECDRLSFSQIEQAIEDFVQKARSGNISVQDLQGGGFTITNGGVFGSLLSTPILNPPQSGILGMHKIEKRPVVINDQIVIRSMMYVALSYDHRIIDGKEAVSFLVALKNVLEDPSRLLIDV